MLKARRIGELGLSITLVALALVALCQFVSEVAADTPWGTNQQVTDESAIDPQRPDIAADNNGNAYAVWQDYRYSECWDVYFSHAPKGGSWAVPLTINPGACSREGTWPAIDVDGSGNLYAVWVENETWNGERALYFSSRPAGGAWTTPITVNDVPSTELGGVDLVVDQWGNGYVVWSDERSGDANIYFSHRPAGGSWGANVRVDDDPVTADQYSPQIAIDPSGNAYAVWLDRRYSGQDYNTDIFFSFRPTGGAWGPSIKVNDEFGTAWPTKLDPDLAVDDQGNAYAIWCDQRSGGYDIYFSFRPAGSTWGPNIQVDSGAGTAHQYSPVIAVDHLGTAYASWRDKRYIQSDIYSSVRPPGGEWGVNIRVNDDQGWAYQDSPAIDVDPSGSVYVVWRDYRLGDPHIYFTQRPDLTDPIHIYLPLVIK